MLAPRTGFFSFAHKNDLKVFFNDHPKPLSVNASGSGPSTATVVLDPAELAFRWNGTTSMMARGLDFWWYVTSYDCQESTRTFACNTLLIRA